MQINDIYIRLFRTSQIEVSDPEYQTRIWTSICYDRKSDDQNNNLKSLPNILSSGFSLAYISVEQVDRDLNFRD